ncbi:MAG TPA: aspartate--tRNA(Asn) ligase [Gemmatimonadaceae bacterium]|nr:aspartate--tRNA(Asn) ligase [Gemmatimonadaceae bacterium]
MHKISGFVSTKRVLKSMIFLIVEHRAGATQVTIDRGSALAAVAEEITPGSAIIVTGGLEPNPAVKLGGVEMRPTAIDVVGPSAPELPIDDHTAAERQLDWRFLALRRPRNRAVFEVQTTVERAMREYWAEHGFIELHSPKLMHSASESGSETFSMNYFDLGRAYLAQSPQFYKQMAMAAGFERVFEIGPVFRAEPSMTPRHATEFTSVDIEMSWIASHVDIMSFEEQWLRHVIIRVNQSHGLDIDVPAIPFPRLTMAEAHERLREMGHTIAATTKPGDIDPEGERLLCGDGFLFLTDYPASLRPFYHMRNGALTNSFDLLWKGVEITTGAQREHRYAMLERQARGAGLGKSVDYYLDFFKYGCPPHGGFGLGLARVVMLMLGLPSIREATFLHRGPNRLTP